MLESIENTASKVPSDNKKNHSRLGIRWRRLYSVEKVLTLMHGQLTESRSLVPQSPLSPLVKHILARLFP